MKKLIVMSLCLLLACSSVWSVAKSPKALSDATSEATVAVTGTRSADEKQKLSVAELEKALKPSAESRKSSDVTEVSKSALSALKERAAEQEKDIAKLTKDYDKTKALVEKQAKQMDTVKAGTRVYAKADTEMRFNDNKPVFGAGGTVGVEFNNGIMLEGGAIYDFIGNKRGGLNDLGVHLSAGYKF